MTKPENILLLLERNLKANLTNEERQFSESQLENLISNDMDSPFHLLNIAADPAVNINIKMIALLTLKNNFDKLFPAVSDKLEFKKQAFNALKLSGPSKLRDVAAYIMAKLIHSDAMEGEYFDIELLEYWLQQLSSQSVSDTKLALSVLSDFLREESNDTYFPTIASKLFPILYQLITQNTDDVVKVQVLNVFSDCLHMLSMMKDQSESFTTDILQQWIPIFVGIIQAPGLLMLKNITLDILAGLVKTFKVTMKPFLESFVGILWAQFKGHFALYKQSEIDGRDCDLIEKELEIHVDYNVMSHTQSYFELFLSLMTYKSFSKMMANNMGEFLSLLTDYSQMTVEQEETWSQDLSIYITENDVDTSSNNVRGLLIEFVEELSALSLNEFASALFTSVLQYVSQSGSNQKLFESYFHLLVISASDVQSSDYKFDWNGFYNQFLAGCLNAGKALLLAGTYSSCFDITIQTQLLQRFVSSFQKLNIESVNSLRAILFSFDNLSAEIVKPLLPGFYQFVLTHLSDERNEEIAGKFLEVLYKATRIDQTPLYQYQDNLSQLIIYLYTKFPFESATSDLASEVLASLVTDPILCSSLENYVLPRAIDLMKNPPFEDANGIIPSTLNLVKCFVESKGEISSPMYVDLALLVVHLLFRTEDPNIHQYGYDLLKHMLRKNISMFKNASLDGAESLLSQVFKLVCMVIETKSESVGLFISEVADAIIDTMRGELSSHVLELVSSIFKRFDSNPSRSYLAALCSILGRVLFYDELFAVVYPVLKSQAVHFQFFLARWIEGISESMNQVSSERLEMCLLAKLLTLQDGDLQMSVHGDEILNSSSKIVTRSAAKTIEKKYVIMPFYLRAIQLLLRYAVRTKTIVLPESQKIPETEDNEDWQDLSSDAEEQLTDEYDDVIEPNENDPTAQINLYEYFKKGIRSVAIPPELVGQSFSAKEMIALSLFLQ